MTELLAIACIGIGVFFLVISGIGVVRLPDFMTRMQALTKATTVGIGFVLFAVPFYFESVELVLLVLPLIGFFMATAPMSAHVIGRAAHRDHIRMWEHTWRDELAEARERGEAPPFRRR